MEKTVTKNCNTCDKSFEALLKEVNRGNAKYCSLSCANKSPKNYNSVPNICRHCGIPYVCKSHQSSYCSTSCKLKNYRNKAKNNDTFCIRKYYEIFKNTPCELCGWSETTRDLHHIIPVAKGGKTAIENLLCVCPNHHRMIHKNLITQDDLLLIVQQRTISSPLQAAA